MTSLILLLMLSIIGISETIYLIRKRIASQKPFCPMRSRCDIVLASKYNKVFKIPNDMLGLLFYITIALMSAFLIAGTPPVPLWMLLMKISIIIGSLMSLMLVYIEWQIIKAWCFWCTMSAITMWLMGIILLIS